MKTITEIKALPLIERQKTVIDLRNVPASDKFYAVALQLINAATSMKDWKEPAQIEVTNIADHDVTVDKTKIAAGQTAKVYHWQYLAAIRFLKATSEDDHDLVVSTLVRKAGKNEDAKPLDREDVLKIVQDNSASDERIAKIVAQVLKGMGIKAATALIAFALLLFCSGTAKAQSQLQVIGSNPFLYSVAAVGGLAGYTNAFSLTNAWVGTETFTNSVTNTVSITTNVVPNVVNGTETFTTNYTTNVVVNIPGLVSVVNYDKFDLFFGFQPMQAAGAVTGGTATWDTSPDGINWQLGSITEYVATNALLAVGTNVSVGPGFGPGYIRLNNITFPGTGFGSNVVCEIVKKPNISGP